MKHFNENSSTQSKRQSGACYNFISAHLLLLDSKEKKAWTYRKAAGAHTQRATARNKPTTIESLS